jgi:hypothetical protein
MIMIRKRVVSRGAALVTTGALLVSSITPLTGAQAGPARPGAIGPVALEWPRDYSTSTGGALRIFQPQVASWDGQRTMVLYAAVSYVGTGAAEPALGTVRLEADTTVAVSERLVNFTAIKLGETSFPGLPNDQLREVVARIDQLVPDGEFVMELDRVLARLDKSEIIPRNVDAVKGDPPIIFFSTSPAVLVNLDGEPIWSPIRDNDLKFAVNTNWDLFQHTPTGALFLRYDTSWLTARALVGPWTPAPQLPESFTKLPADDNWKDVKAAVPGRALARAAVPTVFVSTKPAELILLQGAAKYQAVSGTPLLWVSNTESDVFRLGTSGPVYFLTSGRWFRAPDFTGPWTFATTSLPDEFKQISLEHPRSRVLASVPGTDQAIEAVLLAQIPQTARVSKRDVKAPDVEYDGSPQFEPIEQTTISRAVNTDQDIIKVGDLYYLCVQGVWFMGRSPNGPWEVTGSVPGEIYEIPVSSPAHNVTYVTVEDDDDEWVTFAAVAGYTGMMVAWGCAVWGTGWYYPPYVHYGGFYPVYRPYYPTYGFHASYNPWTGAYSRGMTAYGPYGGAGVGARYNPRTGTYARGAAAWGPYGGRGVAEAYNPRTGAYAATRQGSGVYGSWGQTGVQRGDQWATTSRVTNNRTGTTTRTMQGSGGGAAVTRTGPQGNAGVARTASGDVYAGRDGNVYRQQDSGGWQKYDGSGNWSDVQTPAPRDQTRERTAQGQAGNARAGAADAGTMGQLSRDSAARAEGAQRSADVSRGRTSGGGSYRPSGGSRPAPRGGARRR